MQETLLIHSVCSKVLHWVACGFINLHQPVIINLLYQPAIPLPNSVSFPSLSQMLIFNKIFVSQSPPYLPLPDYLRCDKERFTPLGWC